MGSRHLANKTLDGDHIDIRGQVGQLISNAVNRQIRRDLFHRDGDSFFHVADLQSTLAGAKLALVCGQTCRATDLFKKPAAGEIPGGNGPGLAVAKLDPAKFGIAGIGAVDSRQRRFDDFLPREHRRIAVGAEWNGGTEMN